MGLITKVTGILGGKGSKIHGWIREYPDDPQKELVYRLSRANTNMRTVQYFSVAPYEIGYFIKSGKLVQVIQDGGNYEVPSEDRTDATEIVWITKGEIVVKWGVPWFEKPGFLTKPPDSVSVGAAGEMRVQVVDPEAFIASFLAGRQNLSNEAIQEEISAVLKASLREVFKKYTFKDLVYANKDQISDLTRSALNREFKRWGLEACTNSILSFAFPDDVDVPQEGAEKIKMLKKINDKIQQIDEDLMEGRINEKDHEKELERLEKMKKRYES